ncbi:MAG: response regulator [Chthoniobacterales bacterium]
MNEPTPTASPFSQAPHGRVLVLTPDEPLAYAILAALREAAPGAQTDLARSLEEAQRLVGQQHPDLFVLDVDGIHDLGQEFLYDLRTSHPSARAIVLTAVHLASHREQAAGLGAIHFLEKPFPHGDFVDLVQALLQPGGQQDGEKFQGTLSDLHIADIIQLKCMSGATSVLEFTGPSGEKARAFFEQGQVRHATAPGKDGVDAFNEIVSWKGGMISEVSGGGSSPHTIDLDWQMLLMDAVRKIDENSAPGAEAGASDSASTPQPRKVLVIDDSAMLLNFVNEILTEAGYQVATSATAEEGLRAAASESPHLILLDYLLPDMHGDEVLRRLANDGQTAAIPVVYMSGFGADLKSDPKQNPNVIGSLNKPFTSEVLLTTVKTHMPNEPLSAEASPPPAEVESEGGWAPADNPDAPAIAELESTSPAEFAPVETSAIEAAAGGSNDAWWTAAPSPVAGEAATPLVPASFEPTAQFDDPPAFTPPDQFSPSTAAGEPEIPVPAGGAYFCGDTSFFSLNWALHTIGTQKLTGTLRCFWKNEAVEVISRNGAIVLATTHDPELYCSEAPITLVNVDGERIAAAREQQRATGRPLFVALAQEGLIIREPSIQLVQHYGQKLFAQLWTASRVRFMFEQSDDVPDFARDLPGEDDIDHWSLNTLRFIQFGELGAHANFDQTSIPAYTRDGFTRVQKLRLTVAEAQFASQFNGTRSIAQIAKNLRLDLKFARLNLFRFVALEIIECWPPVLGAKQEKRGVFGRMFGG